MTEKGMTLVELLVVISIVAILAVALGFTYEGWMGRYHVESATRQLYADLEDARARAVQGTDDYFAVISAATANRATYTIMADTNDNGAADDAALGGFPKTIEYSALAYDVNNAALALPVTLTFSKRGIMGRLNATVSPEDTVVNIVSDTYADYNCALIQETRIGLGKMVCSPITDPAVICRSNADCSGGGSCSACQVR